MNCSDDQYDETHWLWIAIHYGACGWDPIANIDGTFALFLLCMKVIASLVLKWPSNTTAKHTHLKRFCWLWLTNPAVMIKLITQSYLYSCDVKHYSHFTSYYTDYKFSAFFCAGKYMSCFYQPLHIRQWGNTFLEFFVYLLATEIQKKSVTSWLTSYKAICMASEVSFGVHFVISVLTLDLDLQFCMTHAKRNLITMLKKS